MKINELFEQKENDIKEEYQEVSKLKNSTEDLKNRRIANGCFLSSIIIFIIWTFGMVIIPRLMTN